MWRICASLVRFAVNSFPDHLRNVRARVCVYNTIIYMMHVGTTV